jgi:hypothetical protein
MTLAGNTVYPCGSIDANDETFNLCVYGENPPFRFDLKSANTLCEHNFQSSHLYNIPQN